MSLIQDFLESLTLDGGDGNFLIVNITDTIYIQFAASKGGSTVYCETPKKALLEEQQIAAMYQLGWKDGKSDFHHFYCQKKSLNEFDALNKIEQLIHNTAAIYGITNQQYTFDLNLE